MSPKETSQKIGLDLTCFYYATPEDSQNCLAALTKYLDRQRHEKLPDWELVTSEYRADGPGLPENAVRIVMLDVGFKHNWMTLENLGSARCTFSAAVNVLECMLSQTSIASGGLRRDDMFSFTCSPSCNIGSGTSWGIGGTYFYCYPSQQPGANGSAQKDIQELFFKYTKNELADPLCGTKATSLSSARALKEACRRVETAEENTGPLWNAIYYTSVLDRDPLQLDIDLAVFTMKKAVRWYDELLALFKVAIQQGDVVGRVSQAVDQSEFLSAAVLTDDKRAKADKMSMTSDSDATLCDEKGTGKITVIQVEDAGKAWDGAVEKQLPQKRKWWRVMLNSIGIKVGFSKRERRPADTVATMQQRSSEVKRAHASLRESVDEFAAQVDQLRLLAKGFILLVKLQTEWPQVEAMAKKPGVNMAEVNKVTTVNIMELSCYNQRTKTLSRRTKRVKEADKAMMRDAISIVERNKKLEEDLEGIFQDIRQHRGR
ncbi:hypothetical protein CH063_05155 [Colletotrichum higginsianum]|uniref:Uncharacterized protein n=1 Tax=Colletotrichum higginsianum (strain IMI 349063) TaxID=759273 RepID=H1UY02_COLHI|nr:hypothetical protein CH63R_08386 [Colletotrichum higginsianum IMI 349063]OBR09621.1 hypothetical protein CH63R_08386 [Colletotrichum higginsianum IMI 349063]CCF32853.1 hypothetical protein CH063_05155 [Colletotrichum higginsianum]